MQWLRKITISGGGLAINLPQMLSKLLRLERGDGVLIEWKEGDEIVKISRSPLAVVPAGEQVILDSSLHWQRAERRRQNRRHQEPLHSPSKSESDS